MIPAAGEAGKTLFEESRALCLRSAKSNAAMLGHYIAINRKPMPWLAWSTRETIVMLVLNGLHLYRSSALLREEKYEQDPELQDCVDILQLMSRVGLHVADMAHMLHELAAPITPRQSS
ncbi:hypothetical protein BDV93DRAFT_231694 [Ceratobasidium sp. AG-I]|nr:hypothetical protein BDV93DRAFT_231694 [Ceratobasidium sp. AG-I]